MNIPTLQTDLANAHKEIAMLQRKIALMRPFLTDQEMVGVMRELAGNRPLPTKDLKFLAELWSKNDNPTPPVPAIPERGFWEEAPGV